MAAPEIQQGDCGGGQSAEGRQRANCEAKFLRWNRPSRGLRIGLLLAVLVIFLLLAANFQSLPAGARNRADHSSGAVRVSC